MLNHLILAIPGNPVIGEPASAFTYALNSAVLALGFGVTTVLVAFLVRSSLFAVQRMQMRQVVAMRHWMTDGSQIRLTDHMGTSYSSFIVSTDLKNFIVKAPIEDGVVVPLPVSSRYRALVTGKDGLYEFPTEVTARRGSPNPVLIMLAPRLWQKRQRRLLKRASLADPLAVNISTLPGSEKSSGLILDICVGGARLRAGKLFNAGSIVKLENVDLNGKVLPPIPARVVASEAVGGVFMSHLAFAGEREEDRLAIASYVTKVGKC